MSEMQHNCSQWADDYYSKQYVYGIGMLVKLNEGVDLPIVNLDELDQRLFNGWQAIRKQRRARWQRRAVWYRRGK